MSKTETKKCQNCQREFVIEPEDFAFYEKIKVPPPTWCPECRLLRRYAWRNERILYRRPCDMCGKSTVTIYSSNKPYKVYCPSCWWSDKWDTLSYGQEYDFSKPFFEQFRKLQLQVPRIALLTKNSINSEYTNHSADNKDCYLSFVSFYCENVLYSNWIMRSQDCLDCSYIYEKLERCYQCLDSRNCYGCQYGVLLRDCMNCYYCYDCHNCTDCFLSSNLRNKKYYFLNTPYSKEEYFRKLKEYNLSSFLIRQELYSQYLELISKKSIHRYTINEKSVNSIGGTIFNSKRAVFCFDVEKLEDCKYCASAIDAKDCMDSYHFGISTELIYESHAIANGYYNLFSHLSYDNSHITYCDSCHNSNNLFGCVGLKKGNYCILNKPYSKNEYHHLVERIIENMKKFGEYGEFFPVKLSPFGYNETQGQIYIPLNKDDVEKRGWYWEERLPGIFGQGTIKWENIPDEIDKVSDSIINEILTCSRCQKNYRLINRELDFYRSEKIPIPHKCHDCRYSERMKLRPLRKLWHRKCMCGGQTSANGVYKNTIKHFHGDKPCPNEFETTYAPERKEIVYCEKCYLAEVV